MSSEPPMWEELVAEFGEVFGRIVWNTLDFEGYESNDPNDAGGYTRFGFASATHGDNLPDTAMEAASRYHSEYWAAGLAYPYKAQQHPPLAAQVFDFGVTSGPRGSARVLQQSLNLAFPEHVPLLSVDGWTGPKTEDRIKMAANYWLDHGGWWCPVLTIFKSIRARHYLRYQETRPDVVVRGLLKRLDISTAEEIRHPKEGN